MKIKKKIKKKSGSKTEILRNLEAQPKRLVSYKKKKRVITRPQFFHFSTFLKRDQPTTPPIKTPSVV